MLRKSFGSQGKASSIAACKSLLKHSRAGHCLRQSRQLLISCWERLWLGLRFFCFKSELAGLSYLVAPNYHWTERVFWLFCLILNFALAVVCVRGFYSYYAENVFQSILEDQPSSNGIEFPAIAVCELGYDIQSAKIKRLMKDLEHSHKMATNDFENVLLALVNPHYHKLENQIFQKFINFTLQNGQFEYFNNLSMKSLVKNVTSTCDELFEKCRWRNIEFNCCEYFSLLNSMSQSCYVLNSLQANSHKRLDMLIFKNETNPHVALMLKSKAQAFVLSKEEIPQFAFSVAKTKTIGPRRDIYFAFRIKETYNDPNIYKLSSKITGCVPPFKDTKNNNQTYKFPSYTTCLADCLRSLQLLNCECISHALNEGSGQNRAPFCNLSGYGCLEQANLFSIFTTQNFRNTNCELCLPSCNENYIEMPEQGFQKSKSKYGTLSINLSVFPRKRIRRLIIRSELDVFIMLGGIFALFMDCSLVHLIELLFCIVCSFLKPNLLN